MRNVAVRAPRSAAPSRRRLLAALALAVLAMGSAAPLIRASAAPPLAIALWRMVFTAAVTAALWRGSGRPRPLPFERREVLAVTAAGVLLAVHFAAWIASLGYTTVAASVTLVDTQPVFAALLAAMCLGEAVRRRQALGIVIAVLGASGILLDAAGDGSAGRRPVLGAGLALIGAVTAAGYYVIGRALRRGTRPAGAAPLPLMAYVTLVYGIAAAALLLACLATATPVFGHSGTDWTVFVLLALGPGLLGHTLLNWALRWLPAPAVSVATLGEPIVATLAVAVIPAVRELPGPATVAGGVVTLAGIALTLSNAGSAPRSPCPRPSGSSSGPRS